MIDLSLSNMMLGRLIFERGFAPSKCGSKSVGVRLEVRAGAVPASAYTAFRIDDRQDNAFNKATIQAFWAIPDKLKKSFTVDNGKELAAHQELTEATGMKVYFL